MKPCALCVFVLFLLGCGGTGLGVATKRDLQMQLEVARPGITTCYVAALQRNRNLSGMLTLDVLTEPKTGRFNDVKVLTSELNDPTLEGCVVTQISQLKLADPTTTVVGAQIPFRFTPVD